MPHKCVRCGNVYENNAPELLKGCSCGSRVFVLLQQGQKLGGEYSWLEKKLAPLTREHAVSIELDSVENIRILERGNYELDVASLMKGEPMVVKSDKGVYYIKLPQQTKE